MLDARCEIEAGKRTNKPYQLLDYKLDRSEALKLKLFPEATDINVRNLSH